MIYEDNCKQGSDIWFRQRMGIPTSSNFKELLVKPKKAADIFGKGALTYMYKLAGERLIGEPQHNHTNDHMQRGHDNEPYARDAYSFHSGNEVRTTGIILQLDENKNRIAGYSPDGLVEDDGTIEIKDKLPHLQIETILADVVPKEHMPQIQGGLWVSEREWCDFVSYCPKLLKPFVKRVYRDEEMISKIAKQVSIFNYELDALCEQLKKWSEQ